MNAREIERALTAVLHQDAEDAMKSTNTQQELQRFEADIEDRSARSRRGWAVGGIAAAGVAAVVGFALWSSESGERADSGPAGDPRQDAAEVAEGFVKAFAAGDVNQAASYLAPGPQWQEFRSEMREKGAWRREYFFEPCQETPGSSALGASFECTFAYDVLRSDELGLEPFGNNLVTLTVQGDDITFARVFYDYTDNGQGDLFAAIGAWVQKNHPGDWAFMENTEGYTKAEMRRWQQLWDQYSRDYVDAMTQ